MHKKYVCVYKYDTDATVVQWVEARDAGDHTSAKTMNP